MRRLTECTVEHIPAADAAGLTVPTVAGPATRAATMTLADTVDALQYALGGPCVTALIEPDPSRAKNWPPRARAWQRWHRGFTDRTGVDIATMRSALGRLASGDAVPLADIRHLAHRMVGTGATLGFESLSERAHDIERLTEGCAAGVLPDERMRAQLVDALDALSVEFSRQLKQRGSAT
jgi:HPt (histidine-containing phosphotransfer) domain-containing protein